MAMQMIHKQLPESICYQLRKPFQHNHVPKANVLALLKTFTIFDTLAKTRLQISLFGSTGLTKMYNEPTSMRLLKCLLNLLTKRTSSSDKVGIIDCPEHCRVQKTRIYLPRKNYKSCFNKVIFNYQPSGENLSSSTEYSNCCHLQGRLLRHKVRPNYTSSSHNNF